MNNWIIETLGWTLLHSLWQLGFAAIILFIALRILREYSANLRHLASISALSLSLILPLATFFYLSTNSAIDSDNRINPLPITQKIPEPIQSSKIESIQTNSPSPPTNTMNKTSASLSSLYHNFLPVLVIFWLIGVIFFSIRLVGGIWTVHLYKTRKVSAVETYWQEKFVELCNSLQIKQKVRLLQSKWVEAPVVIGWLRPVVLIPASAFLQIPPHELETILIHELTHIKRHDYLVNFVQTFVEILFFYHPCVWWISSQIGNEREFAVDEFVTEFFDTEQFVYAKALASLEEIRLVGTQSAPSLAMAGTGGNLMKRIEKILNGNRKINSKNVSIWSAVFAITFVLGVSAGVYGLKTSQAKKSNNGRKIAVVFSNFLPKGNKVKTFEKILELQKIYQIPATWILDSDFINELEQSGKAQALFRQAHESQSDFIIYQPYLNSTVFINGDDEYTESWKKQIQYIDALMAENGDQIKYCIPSSNNTLMKDFIEKKGLKITRLPFDGDDLSFHIAYEKDCITSKNGVSCQETSPEKRKEIRENYPKYVSEILDFNEKYTLEKFGLKIPWILSLPTGDLTNDSVNELFQMLQDKGYEFVPLEEVTANETYKLLDTSRASTNREFSLWRYKIRRKYLPKEAPFSNSVVETSPKDFKVEVKTKDFKIKPD